MDNKTTNMDVVTYKGFVNIFRIKRLQNKDFLRDRQKASRLLTTIKHVSFVKKSIFASFLIHIYNHYLCPVFIFTSHFVNRLATIVIFTLVLP